MLPSMSPARARASRLRLLIAGTAALLVLAGCSAADPSLDERIEDLDTAIELYRTVDGAECDEPSKEPGEAGREGAVCEDGATILWSEDDTDDEFQRKLTSAILGDEHGIEAVVGVNVTITNVDREAVAAQIGGNHP